MNPYAQAVRVLGRTHAFAWLASRVMPPLDRRFAGRARAPSSLGTGLPLCFLHVRSRRTGRPRVVPLLHVADGERIAVFASNWGRPTPPDWALDLEADPSVRVSVSGVERPCRARRATPEEARRYWGEAVGVWPGYRDYRERAGREIRIFVLEPSANEVRSTDSGRAASGAPASSTGSPNRSSAGA